MGIIGQTENEFWAFFDKSAEPRLAFRSGTFRATFEYLDKLPDPIVIIETGCARAADNWEGDGQSTIMFDRYVTSRGKGSHVYSVDIDANAVASCKAQLGENSTVTASDSVAYLDLLTRQLVGLKTKVALVYLDSYDLDVKNWFPSAAHHLKELVAVWRAIGAETLVVVDDCPMTAQLVPDGGGGFFQLSSAIGGKGTLIAEFAEQVGAQQMFAAYQAGWTGFSQSYDR